MKFCVAHWDRLKEQITAENLFRFVSNSGGQAVQRMREARDRMGDPEQPADPLMMATSMIYANAIRMGGEYLLEGDYCPLCELEENTTDKADDWIVPCCSSIREFFVDKGWIRKVDIQ